MGLFDVNIENYGLSIIPTKLRRAVTTAYIKSQLNPLITSQNTYLTTFRAKAKDDAIRNAQKIMLEDRLNIDFSTTGIYLETFTDNLDTSYFYSTNEVNPPPVFFYSVAEAPVEADTIFMYRTTDYIPTNNFTVYVPAADVIADPDILDKVEDNVKKYKVAGTNFNVEQY